MLPVHQHILGDLHLGPVLGAMPAWHRVSSCQDHCRHKQAGHACMACYLLVWQDAHAPLHRQLLLLCVAEHSRIQLEANLHASTAQDHVSTAIRCAQLEMSARMWQKWPIHASTGHAGQPVHIIDCLATPFMMVSTTTPCMPAHESSMLACPKLVACRFDHLLSLLPCVIEPELVAHAPLALARQPLQLRQVL